MGYNVFLPSDHTFVVCAYKENPYIGETIESLKSQTVRGNIILSTSTPSAYLDGVCRNYGIEMVVNPNPHHAGDDWNYGYNAARTKLVTIAHQDDIYDPTYLESMLQTVNRFPEDETLLAFSDYYELREGSRVDTNKLLTIKRILNAPLKIGAISQSKFARERLLSFGNSICCPAVMLVKSNIGSSPFDTTYINSCDYKTWVDLAMKRGRFLYCPEHLMGHRIYGESATSRNIENDIRRKEDLEILSSLWPKGIAKIVNRIYATSEKSNVL